MRHGISFQGRELSSLAVKHFHIYHETKIDCKSIIPGQPISLRKLASFATATERRKLTVIETIYRSLNYMPALKDHYTACVVNVRLIEIVKKLRSSHLLTTNSTAIYTLYITLDKMTMKWEAIFTLLANFAKTHRYRKLWTSCSLMN